MRIKGQNPIKNRLKALHHQRRATPYDCCNNRHKALKGRNLCGAIDTALSGLWLSSFRYTGRCPVLLMKGFQPMININFNS